MTYRKIKQMGDFGMTIIYDVDMKALFTNFIVVFSNMGKIRINR